VNLGTIYFNAGRLDDALTSFQIALSLSPEYIGAHYFVGTVLLLQTSQKPR
jgi:cytochrome c-type biogenesis protein CcmH/NrfG